MVTKLFRAPKIDVEFEERIYGLGDPVEVSIEIDAGEHPVRVRAGAARLVCEVFRIETHDSVRADRPPGGTFMGEMTPAPVIRRRSRVERHEFHVMDRTVFLEDADLPAGVSTHRVTLRVSPDMPISEDDQADSTKIVVDLDIARGRDATGEWEVDLHLPAQP